MRIIDYFIQNAQAHPDKIAIIFEQTSLTYRQISDDIAHTCQLLNESGIKNKTHVLIALDNSIEFAILMLSLADIGAVLVPVSPTLPPMAMKQAIEASDSTFLISKQHIISKLIEEQEGLIIKTEQCISIDKPVAGARCFNEISHLKSTTYQLGLQNILPEQDYILTMTSGSTGDPKPIVFTQTTKLNRAFKSAKELYGLTSDDVIIASSPMYHSLAQRLLLLPLLIGGTSVILKKFSPIPWLKTVQTHKVTFAILVSSNLELLLEARKETDFDISSLHTIVSSSALLKPDIKEACIQYFEADFHEMYGASEVGTVTNLDPKDAKNKFDSVGKALPYVDLKIVDEKQQPVKIGHIGEIICKSTTAFSRYYKRPKATQESVIGGYFYTGDLGYMDDADFLYFTGRKKDTINVGGALVYPKDIEEVIYSCKGVAECAVIGVDDIYFGEAILAVIVLKDPAVFDLKEVKIKCRNTLADYQQPMGYEILEALPKNPMGKVMKFKLKEMFFDYDASNFIRKLIK